MHPEFGKRYKVSKPQKKKNLKKVNYIRGKYEVKVLEKFILHLLTYFHIFAKNQNI